MTQIAIWLLLAVPLAIWIALPLFGPRERGREVQSDEREALIEQKNAVYRSILDLELDQNLGKVSREDAVEIRAQHEAEALDLLKRIDMASETDVSRRLEEEIAEARRLLSRNGR